LHCIPIYPNRHPSVFMTGSMGELSGKLVADHIRDPYQVI
jgi:hypothetical protein